MVEFRQEDFLDDSQLAMRSKQANAATAAAETLLSLMNTHGISKQSKARSPTGTFLPITTPLTHQ